MRFWILVGGSVLVLAAAIWPVGKKTEPPPAAPVAANVPPPATQTPEPPKVLEVIDLSRAYDPVREPDEPITPATFIEVPTQVERLDVMPRMIMDWNIYRGLDHQGMPYRVSNIQIDGKRAAREEKLDVTPREVVLLGNGLMDYVPEPRLVFVPMGVPYATDVVQPIPPNAVIQNSLLNFTPTGAPPVERLEVMPREVNDALIPAEMFFFYLRWMGTTNAQAERLMEVLPWEWMPQELKDIVRIRRKGQGSRLAQQRAEEQEAANYLMLQELSAIEKVAVMPRLLPARFVIEQPDGRLLHYVEVTDGAVVRVPHCDSPADEHRTHPIQRAAFTVPLIPVERLTVEPRVHVVIQREEQERQTGVREDDFTGYGRP